MENELVVRRITDPSDLDLMTTWMFNWWGSAEGYSVDAVRIYLSRSLNAQVLPQTYGLYLDGALVGMYQFQLQDLFTRPEISPWLANVYIDEAYRGRGYAHTLLSSIADNAREAGIGQLHLFTKHVGLYEKFGWEFVEEVETFLEPHIQRLYKLDL